MTSYQLITTNIQHRCFEEIMSIIRSKIIDSKFQCDTTIDDVKETKNIICFGAHMYSDHLLRKIESFKQSNVIVYNLEQLCDTSPYNTTHYLNILRKYKTWDYNRSNIKWLSLRGINALYVPLTFSESLMYQHHPIEEQKKTIDVLFYGSMNDRRMNYIRPILANKSIKTHITGELFFQTRGNFVQNSKIVLNIHFYENARRLETSRICPLLANKAFVISEYGCDEEDNKEFSRCLVFIKTPQELYDRVVYYLQHSNERYKIAEEGFKVFSLTKTNYPIKT